MSEATPRPWAFEKYGRNYALRQDSHDKRYFAALHPRLDQFSAELGKANARFIVRACNSHDELLGALKEMVRCWHEEGVASSAWDAAEEAAEEAIARAEGRS